MSDEVELAERDNERAKASDREPTNVDEVRARGDDPLYAPQGPGDVGYEAPLVVPELDLEGGTKFVVGEDEYESLADANEALAPEEPEVVEETTEE